MNTSEEALDLITLLLHAEEKKDPRNFPYTHQDMLAECFSFFGGGQDTTGTIFPPFPLILSALDWSLASRAV